jgi:hypothetical protein
LFRFLFIALAFASTSLFAQAVTAAVAPSAQGQHQTLKVAKKKHRKHKKK